MPDPSGGLATLAWTIFRDGKTPAEDLTEDEDLKAKPEDEDDLDRKPKKGKT